MGFTEVELALWLAVAVVGYAYVGYPVLLAIAARWLAAPEVRRSQEHQPTVCVIIVAHNEEARLARKLENCASLDYPAGRLEILVVSDGSTDGTERVAESFADRGVRLLSSPAPARGKAVAIAAAVEQTSAELLLLCDTRQELAPDALRVLASSFADPTVGAVSGELHIDAEEGSAAGHGVGAYWRYEKQIRRLESRFDSAIGVTGAIYAIRRDAFRAPHPGTILDDVSIPMDVILSGRRVLFEPAAQAWDRAEAEAHREYRRKVRTLAGNYQLLWLHPRLLDPRANRALWQFLSHKVLRLLVPWCLLVTLVASAVLAASGSWAYGLVLAAQIVFYLLAVLGVVVGRWRARPRLLSIPYAFTLLNLAAASGLFGFLFGTERASWRRARS